MFNDQQIVTDIAGDGIMYSLNGIYAIAKLIDPYAKIDWNKQEITKIGRAHV